VTTAPASLLDLRAYLADAAGVGLDQFGIVGDVRHTGGYHLGRDRIYTIPPGYGDDDYSIALARDRNALTNYASAIDIKFGTNYKLLRNMSIWLVERCKAGAADCKDIREVVYSPDGVTVIRWDREGVRGGGNDSHRYHTHVSPYRDTVTHDLTIPYRIYFDGGDMQITAQVRERWHPTTTALPDGTDRSNGVLRGTPNRGAPIVQRIAAGGYIVTVAEVRTIAGSDGDFRLVEWIGRDPLYALRSDWISDGFAIEPVTESNKDGYNTAMREISAYSAGKVIP
jgi:hypothetical protein